MTIVHVLLFKNLSNRKNCDLTVVMRRCACMQLNFTSPSAYAACRVLRVHHIATRPHDAAPRAAPTATTDALDVKPGCCDAEDATRDMSPSLSDVCSSDAHDDARKVNGTFAFSKLLKLSKLSSSSSHRQGAL